MKLAHRMESIPFSGIRKVFEEVNRRSAAGEDIIHLEIGRPDFDTPVHIKEAAKGAAKNAAKQAAKGAAKNAAKQAAKNAAKNAAKQAAKKEGKKVGKGKSKG